MIKFLLKGLLRDRHRSRFPVITVMLGVTLTVVMHSWVTGIFSDMIDSNAAFSTGHVKVVTRAYAEEIDQLPNDLAILELEQQLGVLRREHPAVQWVPRTMFGGLLDVPDEQGETRVQATVAGWGVHLLDPAYDEIERLGIGDALVKGALPARRGEVLISDDLADRLVVTPGQSVTIIGATINGSMAIATFELAGTVRFGLAPLDRGAIIADLADVQAWLDMTDGSGEILGYMVDPGYTPAGAAAISAEFNAGVADSVDEFAPVMLPLREQNGLAAMLDYSTSMMGMMMAVFVSAMGIVLWNAGLIGGIRRYGEIGVRLAIGESKPRLYAAMLGESLLIGITGSALGTIIGLGFGYTFQYWGFDFGDQLKNSSMMMSGVMRAKVTPMTWWIGFVPGVLATLVGTALSGVGIFKRSTAELFKELEN